MKRLALLITITGLLLTLTACKRDGSLRVTNRTDDVVTMRIDNTDYDIESREANILDWSLRYNILIIEEKTLRCEIYERLFLFNERFSLNIQAGTTTNYSIRNNASGLEIKNDSMAFSITHVYISPSTSSLWGRNRISDNLQPGYYHQWNLTEGTWDIKVTDSIGNSFFKYGQTFKTGELNSYNYTGLERTQDPRKDKTKGISEICNEKYRIERLK